MNLSPFSGEQIVQVTNPDRFARPVLRSPVLHTPVWMIACAQLLRLLGRIRAPDRPASRRQPHRGGPGRVLARARLAWPGHHRRPHHHDRCDVAGQVARVVGPARCRADAGTVAPLALPPPVACGHDHRRLAVQYQGRLLLPVLGPVTSTGYTDQLHVRLVSGQSPDDFAAPGRQPRARVRRAVVPHPYRISLARWRWSWSAATPSPRSSRPCPSPPTLTWRRYRSGARKTAQTWDDPAARHPCAARRVDRGGEGVAAVGRSSAACSPPFRKAPCGSSARIRS